MKKQKKQETMVLKICNRPEMKYGLWDQMQTNQAVNHLNRDQKVRHLI